MSRIHLWKRISISDSCEGSKKSKNVDCLKTGLEASDIQIKLYIRTTFLSSLKYFVLLILYCCWYYIAVSSLIVLLFSLEILMHQYKLLLLFTHLLYCGFFETLIICNYIAFFLKLTQLLLYCCFLLRYWCLFYIVVFLKILINLYIVVNL